MRFVVVDDSKVMRAIITRLLRQTRFRAADVVEADNGAAALECLRSDGADLVLTDWNMPVMTGIELLEAMRSEDLAVPVGFITSESTVEMRQVALSSGARFVVTKPFNADTLEEAIGAVLG